MAKVLYAGDYAYITHTYFKGMNSWASGEAFDESGILLDALKSDPSIACDYVATPVVNRDFPRTSEELSGYDVVIISDIGTDSLLLYPDIFRIPMGQNRLHLLERFVQEGGGLALVGGWMSFGGKMGQGKYSGTVFEDILGVDISPFDDRVEVPEGFTFDEVDSSHPITQGIAWQSAPKLFLGYNRFKSRQTSQVLARYRMDPMIVVNAYGKGRAMAFASDLGPHWGMGFFRWEDYSRFWQQVVRWLAGEVQ